MEIKPKNNPEKQALIRFPCGVNLYRIKLYDLSNSQLREVETLSPILNAKNANKKGKQLSQALQIKYYRSFKSVINPELKKNLLSLKQEIKKDKRKQWEQTQEDNWQKWLANFNSEEIALASALKTMNQWIKNLGNINTDERYDFEKDKRITYKEYQCGIERVWVETAYKIKNFWIEANQQYLILGQKVRYETNKQSWLYYHKFLIEEKIFEFHSYLKPSKLSEELAENFVPFSGKSLSSVEITEVKKKSQIAQCDRFIEMLSWKILQKKFCYQNF